MLASALAYLHSKECQCDLLCVVFSSNTHAAVQYGVCAELGLIKLLVTQASCAKAQITMILHVARTDVPVKGFTYIAACRTLATQLILAGVPQSW